MNDRQLELYEMILTRVKDNRLDKNEVIGVMSEVIGWTSQGGKVPKKKYQTQFPFTDNPMNLGRGKRVYYEDKRIKREGGLDSAFEDDPDA